MIALFAVAAGAAEVWFVPDEALGDQLRAAVAEEWPEAEHEVRVGERAPGEDAWSWDGRVLEVVAGEEERSGDADDAHLAALLARTWSIRTDAADLGGWSPLVLDDTGAPAFAPPPEPVHDRWTLAASLGIRGSTGEPGLAQGVRLSQATTLGLVLWTADVYLGTFPNLRLETSGPFSSGAHIETPRMDLNTVGTSLGVRSRGPRFAQATIGIERRNVEHAVARDGFAVAGFTSNDLAIPLRVGAGLRTGRLAPSVEAWGRWTEDLPLTFGADLDLAFVWARARRRVGDTEIGG